MEADTRIEFSLSEASVEKRQIVSRMTYLPLGLFLIHDNHRRTKVQGLALGLCQVPEEDT